jgi:hypothetical protein
VSFDPSDGLSLFPANKQKQKSNASAMIAARVIGYISSNIRDKKRKKKKKKEQEPYHPAAAVCPLANDATPHKPLHIHRFI